MSVSLAVIIASGVVIYTTGVQVNQWYVNWHEVRYAHRAEYALKREVLTLAQAQEIREQIKEARATAAENSQTLRQVDAKITHLDSDFRTYAAVAMVGQLKAQLDRHMREPEDSPRWREDRDRLLRQVEQAELYQNCVLAGRDGCHQIIHNP